MKPQFTFNQLLQIKEAVKYSNMILASEQSNLLTSVDEELRKFKTLIVKKYILDRLDLDPAVDIFHFVCDDLEGAIKQLIQVSFNPKDFTQHKDAGIWVRKFPECHIYYSLSD